MSNHQSSHEESKLLTMCCAEVAAEDLATVAAMTESQRELVLSELSAVHATGRCRPLSARTRQVLVDAVMIVPVPEPKHWLKTFCATVFLHSTTRPHDDGVQVYGCDMLLAWVELIMPLSREAKFAAIELAFKVSGGRPAIQNTGGYQFVRSPLLLAATMIQLACVEETRLELEVAARSDLAELGRYEPMVTNIFAMDPYLRDDSGWRRLVERATKQCASAQQTLSIVTQSDSDI